MASLSRDFALEELPEELPDDIQPMNIISKNKPTGMPISSFSQSQEAFFLAPQWGQDLALSLISLLHSVQLTIDIFGSCVSRVDPLKERRIQVRGATKINPVTGG
jgi:hypothetical protein